MNFFGIFAVHTNALYLLYISLSICCVFFCILVVHLLYTSCIFVYLFYVY